MNPATGERRRRCLRPAGRLVADGEWRCPRRRLRGDAPCQNVDKGIKESDRVYRVNLSWKATDTSMLYATWSEGYRPGGIKRNPFAGDYRRTS